MRQQSLGFATAGRKRLEIRHLSSFGFPMLYQALFSYLMVISGVVGQVFTVPGFVLITLLGMAASFFLSHWLLGKQCVRVTDVRLALPMLIAFSLPLLQLVLLKSLG